MNPDFSIITPSYNMLDYLKRCRRSVADQEGVTVEHLVIDGGSTDGTAQWLAQRPHLHSLSEPDRGMYDALNKGLDRARGSIVAYLNCDEQYLPETLSLVKYVFDRCPDVDLLFGDALLIRPDNSLIAYRKAYQPRWFYILASHLYVLSCTMFFRRTILDEGFRFDTQLKTIGDQDFVTRLLQHGYRASYVKGYLSAFTMTGQNLGGDETTTTEMRQALDAAPWWVRAFKFPLNLARLGEKLLSGAYYATMPLYYALYASADDAERQVYSASKASSLWKSR